MEEGQERDSSPDGGRHIIEDDDMEDSPTDMPKKGASSNRQGFQLSTTVVFESHTSRVFRKTYRMSGLR